MEHDNTNLVLTWLVLRGYLSNYTFLVPLLHLELPEFSLFPQQGCTGDADLSALHPALILK